MARYSDDFLAAVGTWQRGWRESKDRRLEVTARLLDAVEKARPDLPKEAFEVPEFTYRKRFLVANNEQNGGDFVPLTSDGLSDGVASWTTDFDYAKKFKHNPLKMPWPGKVTAIFRRQPAPNEVVLNIVGLWKLKGFQDAVAEFTAGKKENNEALNHFHYVDNQSEVVMDAPLRLSEIHALSGAVSTAEHMCNLVGAEGEAMEKAMGDKMGWVGMNEGDEHWLNPQQVQNVIQRFRVNVLPVFLRHGYQLVWCD